MFGGEEVADDGVPCGRGGDGGREGGRVRKLMLVVSTASISQGVRS
jgi:hypothetical protein